MAKDLCTQLWARPLASGEMKLGKEVEERGVMASGGRSCSSISFGLLGFFERYHGKHGPLGRVIGYRHSGYGPTRRFSAD